MNTETVVEMSVDRYMEYLGRHAVHVTIDRPLGTPHPKDNNLKYPVNYGFISNEIVEDGEEMDVYLIGTDIPIKKESRITCKIVGIVNRWNDEENKLIAVPQYVDKIDVDKIWQGISFREKSYDISLRFSSDVLLSEEMIEHLSHYVFGLDRIEKNGKIREYIIGKRNTKDAELLYKMVDTIKNLKIREFVTTCLVDAPNYFWSIPASRSGHHHPEFALGEGGLLRHVIVALYLVDELAATFGLTMEEKDMAKAAIAIHDTLKYGIEYQENGPKEWFDMHPYMPRSYYADNINILTMEQWHYIMNAVECHMGNIKKGAWSSVKKAKPESDLEMVVHLADYIASRRALDFNFDIII